MININCNALINTQITTQSTKDLLALFQPTLARRIQDRKSCYSIEHIHQAYQFFIQHFAHIKKGLFFNIMAQCHELFQNNKYPDSSKAIASTNLFWHLICLSEPNNKKTRIHINHPSIQLLNFIHDHIKIKANKNHDAHEIQIMPQHTGQYTFGYEFIIFNKPFIFTLVSPDHNSHSLLKKLNGLFQAQFIHKQVYTISQVKRVFSEIPSHLLSENQVKAISQAMNQYQASQILSEIDIAIACKLPIKIKGSFS